MLIGRRPATAEATAILGAHGIPHRVGAGRQQTIRVPPRRAATARRLLAPLATTRGDADGFTLIVTGPAAFAAEAGARLTAAGLRFDRKDHARGRATIRVPILQKSTGIDEVYPLEVDLISHEEESLWRCTSCGRGFDAVVNYCPGCKVFVGDAHGM